MSWPLNFPSKFGWPARFASLMACTTLVTISVVCYGQTANAPTRPSIVQPSMRSAPVIVDSNDKNATQDDIVDESALRFYAQNHQTKRMHAEIRRLQSLHPNWIVPTDLETLKPSPPEEAPLWDLFTAGRFDDLNAAIADHKKADPSWQPSDDLARKLRRSTLRSSIKTFADKKDWEAIATLVKDDPDAVRQADIDIQWLIAEAYAHLDEVGPALDVYKGILNTQKEAHLQVATVQKALSLLPAKDIEPLVSMLQLDGTDENEAQTLKIDLTRAQIIASLHDEPSSPIQPADFAAFKDYVKKIDSTDQTALLGWYAFHRQQYREALDWFRAVMAKRSDAMIAHGVALSLDHLGQEREAEDMAYLWSDTLVSNQLLYTEIASRRLLRSTAQQVEPARLERFAKAVLLTDSGEGSEALGWYAYRSCQYDTALQWFQRASAWRPRQSAILGLALTYQRLNKTREFYDVVNRYDGLFPKVVDLAFRLDTVPSPERETSCSNPAPTTLASSEPLAPVFHVPRPSLRPVATQQATKVKKTDFPIAVAYENPLAFSFQHDFPDHSRDKDYVHEAQSPASLVARRVNGVGPMPYEKLGYSLLPGWNGSDRLAYEPNLSIPPIGTLAHDEAIQMRSSVTAETPVSRGDADRFGAFRGASSDTKMSEQSLPRQQ